MLIHLHLPLNYMQKCVLICIQESQQCLFTENVFEIFLFLFWGCHVFVHLYLKVIKKKDMLHLFVFHYSFHYWILWKFINRPRAKSFVVKLFHCMLIVGEWQFPKSGQSCSVLFSPRPIVWELVRLRQKATRSFQNGARKYYGLVRTLQMLSYVVIELLSYNTNTL